MKKEKTTAASPKKPKKLTAKDKLKRAIIIVIVVISIFALGLSFLVWRKYAKIENNRKEAEELYNPPKNEEDGEATPEIPDVVVDENKDVDPDTGVVEDFNALYKVNKDIIGWIKIPDTPLNLPVVQGTDNVFYLYRSLKKEEAALGIPFADCKATITKERQSENVTVYGHAAANGSYFAPIKKYKDLSYYKEHPLVIFNTIYGDGVYKIVGFFMEDVAINNTERFAYHEKVDLDEEGFNEYMDNVMKRSYFTTGVDYKYGDQLLTLSTCAKNSETDFRFVIVARKVRDGESTAVDVSKAKEQPDKLMPAKWYAENGIENPNI